MLVTAITAASVRGSSEADRVCFPQAFWKLFSGFVESYVSFQWTKYFIGGQGPVPQLPDGLTIE